MKVSTLLLAGSLAANFALAAVFFAGASASHVVSSNSSLPARPATTAPGSAAKTAIDAETWTRLQTDDLPAFLARLRAEGFPPALVRAIMAEQVRVQFAPRRAALNRKGADRPFWEPATEDPKTAAALREIMKEQNQALKDLLGPDATTDEFAAASLHRQFPGLSDDKINELQRIQQDFNERRSDLLTGVNGAILPDDREKLTAIEKAQHDEIAQTLTPQELEDYDLRTSNTANLLRYQLTAFDPTEQEFRTLYQIQSDFSDRLGPMYGPPTQDEMRARAEAQKQLNDQILATLGPERGADYQRAIDNNYRQTSQLVARLDLPPESANDVYAVQKDIQQRVTALRTDPTLSLSDRNQQIAALADEAKAKVTATLGDSGFEAYKQYGGSWLQNLQPRPANTGAPQMPGASTMTIIRQ